MLAGGEDIGRQARVTELRTMVRARRYKVDSYRVAVRIFARAMVRNE